MSEQYTPSRWQWESRTPAQAGMRADGIDEAIAYHRAHTTAHVRNSQDLIALAQTDASRRDEMVSGADFDDIIGPVRARGPENGLILRGGYLVAEWGDTSRVDMTYSVAKSYVATMAGVALDRGLIRDVDDPVALYVDDGKFASERNARITWRHLLRQTSNWDGTLWEKHWSADPQGNQPADAPLPDPGAAYAYNDVRVNLLAYALLLVHRRPLPAVLRDTVMDPIEASRTWQWHGYRNSWVTVDGLHAQSVSGGGHWGGGVWASSRDHARFGLLHLRRGRWGERQVLSERWVDEATAPGDVNPVYGYMWWRNAGGELWPSAPSTSYAALGYGTNLVWVSPEHDLVVVARWIERDAVDGFLGLIIESAG